MSDEGIYTGAAMAPRSWAAQHLDDAVASAERADFLMGTIDRADPRISDALRLLRAARDDASRGIRRGTLPR